MTETFDSWRFLAGLGTFLFGMHFMELALKNLAGRTFKKSLRQFTTNPLKGIAWGTLVTAIVQSSSVVSLMVLAFVGAGILKLRNAIGIIIGSNLGTTFTGWIVVALGFKIDIQTFSLPFIGIGGLSLLFFSEREKLKELSKLLLGFGFLFLGLDFMKNSISGLTEIIEISVFSNLNPYLFFFVGFVLTSIIQSSSAAMVITLSALHSNIIPLEAAVAMIIGNDLGTTITVLLGAIKGVPSKKRVALSHFLFNFISGTFALIFLFPILYFITNIISIKDSLIILVAFHSSFNFIGILIILPFIGPFAKFLEGRFLSEDEQVSIFISKVPGKVPAAAIEALRNEITGMIERVMYLNICGLQINPELFDFSAQGKFNDAKSYKNGNYLSNYDTTKELEGEIIAYYLQIQNEKLDDDESKTLSIYIQSVRHCIVSAKEIKDIVHNIREFENSSNDAKRALYHYLKGRMNEYYLRLNKLIKSDNKSAYFEHLGDLMQINHQIHQQCQNEIYTQISRKSLNEMEISTMMNVNREVYNSNRSLILAVKDIILSEEEAQNFNSLPELK